MSDCNSQDWDLTVDIALPVPETVHRLSQMLKESDALDSRSLNSDATNFQSEGNVQSLAATIFKGRFSAVTWSVQATDTMRSRVRMRFALSQQLKSRLYAAQAILILTYSSVLWVWLNGNLVDPLVGGGLSVIVGSAIIILAIQVLLLYSKHKVRATSIIRSLVTGEVSHLPSAVLVRGPSASNPPVALVFLTISVTTLVSVTVVLVSRVLPLHYFLWPFLATMAFALVTLTVPSIAYLHIKGERLDEITDRKITPFSVHLCFALPILASLWTPYLSLAWFTAERRLASGMMDSTQFASAAVGPQSYTVNIVATTSIEWGLVLNAILPLVIPALFIVLILRSSHTVRGGASSIHQNTLSAIWSEGARLSGSGRPVSLRLPPKSEHLIRFAFLWLSAMCWIGVYLSLTVLVALIIHKDSTTFFWPGNIVVSIYHDLLEKAHITDHDSLTQGIVAACWLGPFLVPALVLGVLHFGALLVMARKTKELVPLTGSLASRIESIAQEMGVFGVQGVLDGNAQLVSPFADIRGVRGRKLIVFSPVCLDFLSQHPDCIDAIVAHELAHLKRDCSIIRRRRILSRCGLVGVGFLSVLNDSIGMEDEADMAARRYLKDEVSVKAAAVAMEVWVLRRHASLRPVESPLVAFGAATIMDVVDRVAHNKSVFWATRIRNAVYLVLAIYLFSEQYDYVHRDVWQR